MIRDELKVEWVNEYLGPGLKKLGCCATDKEKAQYFDLAMKDDYKTIKELASC